MGILRIKVRDRNLAPAKGRRESLDWSANVLPQRIPPMLAQSVVKPFDSPDHLFEIKWDGTRCIAFVEQGRLRLQNRRYVELRDRYPDLGGLTKLPSGTVLDGEIIALDGGKPSFSKLMQRDHVTDAGRVAILSKRIPATLIAFDLLYVRGKSVMELPLVERRDKLDSLIRELEDPHVVAASYVVEHGEQYFAGVRNAGLEGVMAKRIDSPYLPGKRTTHWQKIKVARVEVLDVLGFVPRGKDRIVSALLLGVKEAGRWVYKGNVGSGFNEDRRIEWYGQLSPMPPLADPPKDGPKDASWRNTDLRCKVRFFEETKDGKLRSPVFEGFEP